MKFFYDINKYLIIITLFLYLTFWGGIIAQTILGVIQIFMSITIILNYKKIPKSIVKLFVAYIISAISIIVLYPCIAMAVNGSIGILFILITMILLLALFHLYITYKIKLS